MYYYSILGSVYRICELQTTRFTVYDLLNRTVNRTTIRKLQSGVTTRQANALID